MYPAHVKTAQRADFGALLGILENLMATVLNSNFGPWRVATSANHEKVGIIDQLGRPCLHFEEDGPIEVTATCKNSPENMSDLQRWVEKWNEEFHSGSRWPVTAQPPELQALEAVWPSDSVAQVAAICMLRPAQAAAVLKLAGRLCQQGVLLALEYQSSAPC